MLFPLMNRKSNLSVRIAVLLYKLLIPSIMDYACSSCSCAFRTHVRRLQVLQSKCPRLPTDVPLVRM